jgi:hypothetical protein
MPIENGSNTESEAMNATVEGRATFKCRSYKALNREFDSNEIDESDLR